MEDIYISFAIGQMLCYNELSKRNDDSEMASNSSREAKKQYGKLSHSGQKKPSILDVIDTLAIDLEMEGPSLSDWPNYGIINESKSRFYYHCHLKKGNPTYVACWKVEDEKEKIIEVFYVGTHEKAPY